LVTNLAKVPFWAAVRWMMWWNSYVGILDSVCC
jgi:hypothetical protein